LPAAYFDASAGIGALFIDEVPARLAKQFEFAEDRATVSATNIGLVHDLLTHQFGRFEDNV